MGTKSKAVEILLLMVEIDGKADVVLNAIVPFLTHKLPKLVAAAVFAMQEIVKNFGTTVMDVKIILGSFSKIFAHSDKSVRSEAFALAVELQKWIGKSINSFFDGLKPIQIKELEDSFVLNAGIKPQPLKFSRGGALSVQKHAATIASPVDKSSSIDLPMLDISTASNQGTDDVATDSYENAIPIDVLSLLDEKFFENFTSAKWKEKKEALDFLNQKLDTPRLEIGSYGELVTGLVKKLADTNILVVIGAANCIEKLAKCLRKSLANFKSLIISGLLDRLKEKKQSVTEALSSALNSIFKYLGLAISDIIEPLGEISNQKNPLSKSEAFSWLSRCLNLQKSPPNKAEIKMIAQLLIKGLEDAATEVRDSSIKCFASLLRLVGSKLLAPYTEKLDKLKLAKIEEQLALTNGPADSLSIKSTAINPNLSKDIIVPKSSSKIEDAENNCALTPSSSYSKESKSSNTDSQINYSVAFSFKYSGDSEAKNDILSQFPEFPDKLDSNWKSRLADVEKIGATILSTRIDPECLLRYLSFVTPTWKEINVQIIQKTLSIILYLSKVEFTKAALSLCAGFVSEKLAEPKTKPDSTAILSNSVEKFGIGFVCEQIVLSISSSKNPKILSEASKILLFLISEYGISDLKAKTIVEFCRICVKNSNFSVRTDAISLLCTFRLFYGDSIRSLLKDYPQNVLTTIENEFNKRPVITTLSKPNKLEISTTKDATEIVSDCPQIIDVSDKFGEKYLSLLNHSDWQQRKKALDEMESIIASVRNSKIMPNVSIDVFCSLKNRLGDSNKNLCIQALEVIGKLCERMGKPAEKLLKNVYSSIVACLADNKIQVRSAALKCLEVVVNSCGADFLIQQSTSLILSNENPNLRKDFLKFIAEKMVFVSKNSILLIAQIISALLQDKASDVRKNAQVCAAYAIDMFGCESFCELSKDKITFLLQYIEANPDLQKPKSKDLEMTSKLSSESVSSVENTHDGFESSSNLKVSSLDKEDNKLVKVSPDNVFPFCENAPLDSYQSRSEKGIPKWNLDTAKIENLQDLFSLYLLPAVCAMLFNASDFKECVSGMNALEEALQKESCEIHLQSFVDIMLKYLGLKIIDTNTVVSNKAIDLCTKFILYMDSKDWKLSEFDANGYIPFTVNKLGEAKETTRVKIHEILRMSCRVFPASKIILIISQEGLRSKNSRIRLESLEEIFACLQRSGSSCMINHASKIIPLIAGCLSDKDAGVRNSSLKILSFIISSFAEGASLLKKFVYPILAPKELDFLEERLKRTTKFIVEPQNQDAHSVPLIDSEIKVISDLETMDISKIDTLAPEFGSIKLDFDKVEEELSKEFKNNSQISRQTNERNDGLNLEFMFSNLTSQDPVKCLDGVNSFYHLLAINNRIDLIESRLDQALQSVTITLKMILNNCIFELPSAQTIKLQVLGKLIEISEKCIKPIEGLVNSSRSYPALKDALTDLLAELIQRLVDNSLNCFGAECHLVLKSFNDLIVAVLEYGPKTIVFSILIKLLQETSSDLSSSLQISMANLIMKCLWKLTKAFSTFNIYSIDAKALLEDISDFYTVITVSEWKRRAANSEPLADLPHRTLKAILYEMYKAYQDGLLELATGTEMEYIRITLLSIKEKYSSSDDALNSQQAVPRVVASPGPLKTAEYNELKTEINQLFSRLTSKETMGQASNDLYDFLHRNTGNSLVEILFNETMSKCSSIFQRHVKCQLERIENERKAAVCVSARVPLERFPTGDPYKEKLCRLKEMIGLSTQSAQNTTNNQCFTADTKLPHSFTDDLPREKAPALYSQTDSSVEALKERLARLKSRNAPEKETGLPCASPTAISAQTTASSLVVQ